MLFEEDLRKKRRNMNQIKALVNKTLDRMNKEERFMMMR
jgi:hypothetical protein